MQSPSPGTLAKPRLRPLDPIPFDEDGEPFIAWRDPLNLTDPIQVPRPVALLMTFMDGSRDLAGLQTAWQETTNEELPLDFLRRLVQDLDGCLLLDTPNFHDTRANALEAYRQAPYRPPAHCPGAYPDDPDALRDWLDELLAAGEAAALVDGQVAPRGLVAPHIDLGRGGVAYGAAYHNLRSSAADLFIVLGIAHSSSCWPLEPPLLSLTRQHYHTPLGTLATDTSFVDALVAAYVEAGGSEEALFRDELVHRDEHSLEFQMLFLQHLHGGRPCKVVPILCGSLHEFYEQPGEVGGEHGLGPVIQALRTAIAQYEGEVVVVAGADLSHLGSRFGCPRPADEATVKAIEAGDLQALGQLSVDADRWFAHFAANFNARNVCSVSNLYLVRALLPDARFELLRHEVAFDPEQTVSFAAARLV